MSFNKKMEGMEGREGMETIRTLSTDYYRTEAIRSFIAEGVFREWHHVHEACLLIESDYYRHEVLCGWFNRDHRFTSGRVLEAAGLMRNDYYKSDFLRRFMGRAVVVVSDAEQEPSVELLKQQLQVTETLLH